MAERTLRQAKRPRAYALLIGLVALIVAVGVAGAWRAAAEGVPPAPLAEPGAGH